MLRGPSGHFWPYFVHQGRTFSVGAQQCGAAWVVLHANGAHTCSTSLDIMVLAIELRFKHGICPWALRYLLSPSLLEFAGQRDLELHTVSPMWNSGSLLQADLHWWTVRDNERYWEDLLCSFRRESSFFLLGAHLPVLSLLNTEQGFSFCG